ncbi:MAG: hypothetical protein LC104_21850 [Bacteroidales bacterium]|nr:hypothetical protein [Bacteroidales bacterium]
MRRLGAWGLAAALATGAGVSASWAADSPSPSSSSAKPWYHRLLGADEPSPPQAPAAATPARPPIPTAPLAPEAVAEALQAEQEAYLRRLEVCTKLRQLALESHDDALMQQADTLERQATALYHGRVARFGVKIPRLTSGDAVAQQSTPKPADVRLDEKLGSGVAATPLTRGTATARGSKNQPERPATASARTFRGAPQP